MKTKAYITNTTTRVINTRYRVEKKILSITIQPRALANEISFATKNEFDEWRAQNAVFFDKGILILSDTDKKKSEKELTDKNQELAEKESAKAQDKADKAFSEAEVKAQEAQATLKMKVKQEGKKDTEA